MKPTMRPESVTFTLHLKSNEAQRLGAMSWPDIIPMATPPIYPADLSEPLPLDPNPIPRQPFPGTSSRRETILTLVEMLLRQDEDSDRGSRQFTNFENDWDAPIADKHLQVVGAEAFKRFERRISDLDKELRNFANATRQLGSSVAILSSSYHLRERLAQILFLFRQNATDLYPRKIPHAPRDIVADAHYKKKTHRERTAKSKAPPHVLQPIVTERLDLEVFPEQLESFATDVAIFLDCLNEFPEFTDEVVNASICSFEGDLQYWASCLKEYRGHFRHSSVQRYIHDLSSEMGEHIDSITSSLSVFVEVGVPTIRFAQRHGAMSLLNLSTVATFFSAVTATTLQFSFALSHNSVSDSVNLFWFTSVVFSIAAAVNSLLGLTWKQAMYRSPGHRVPWWVIIWIKRCPLFFLVISITCFSIGLCCFAYASNQAPLTSALTTVFTAFTSFGLIAVSVWFASERYIFIRHHGKKWLSDALIEYRDVVMKLTGMLVLKHVVQTRLSRMQKFSSKLFGTMWAHSSTQNREETGGNTLPIAHSNNLLSREMTMSPGPLFMNSEPPTSPQSRTSFSLLPEEIQTATRPSPGKELWKRAFQRIKMHTAFSSPKSRASFVVGTHPPPHKRATSSSLTGQYEERRRTTVEEPVKVVPRARIANIQPKLRELEPTQDFAAHLALVRHLQFSPDGKYLATSSWDRTSVIFRVGDPLVSHRVLSHPQGFVGQVEWSPDGTHLLTKLSRSINIWTLEVGWKKNGTFVVTDWPWPPKNQDGVCKKVIDRKFHVESIAWFPNGKAFISVEGSGVTRLDLQGTVLDQHYFGRVKLHKVAITPDSQRLIGVGTLLESPTGLKPSKSRAEKQLIIYNLETHQVESQIPVLNDVRDVTVVQTAGNGFVALISYENKAPPQLWKMESVKDRENNTISARLTLRHTYMPRVQVDFAGPSYFGGRNNELVICTGKGGDIHIWDQESGALLRHIRPRAYGGDITCMAWNHARENSFMFATGSHEGSVRVWTKRPAQGEDVMDDLNMDIDQGMLLTSSPSEFNARELSESPCALWNLESSQSRQPLQTQGSDCQSRVSGDMQEWPRPSSTVQSLQARLLGRVAGQPAYTGNYAILA